MDSTALAFAMNKIQKLKLQLDGVSQSEASQARHAESAHAEIQSLRIELTETLVLVEKLKDQLNDNRDYKAQAIEEVGREMELELAKNNEKKMHSEYDNIMELYNSLLAELEQSKDRVKSFEELAVCLQTGVKTSSENGNIDDESWILKTELNDLKSEVDQLRSALEVAERRYKDEYIQSTLQIRNAYDMLEHAKSESSQREAELGAKLKESMAEVKKLRTILEKENALLILNKPDDKDDVLELRLKKSESNLEDLKVSLLEKEARLISIIEENEKLKSEIMKIGMERSKANDEVVELSESLRSTEKEALTKLGSLTEEADESYRKVTRVTEQLDAAQASNAELKIELRRLKVQCDQWRKATEAAAAMLSTGNNGKYVERTGYLDYHTIGKKLSSSPHSEDTDDDSPKKKNCNMLKKIGMLLKKGQK